MTRLHQRYVELINDYQSNKIKKKAFLDLLQNNFFGGSGLEVCMLKKLPDGDRSSTKWQLWDQVRDSPWWVENINQRRIAPCEIVFDIEEKELVTAVFEQLDRHNICYLPFFTGSRGVHAHAFSDELMKINTNEMRDMLSYLGADIQKASNRTLIALEFAPHWKTGNKKEVLSVGI